MKEKASDNAETEKHLKTVAKGAGLVFFGLAFSKVLTYFYRLIIARYYGPGDYGLISIGLSVITVLITILILGMDSGMVRFIPEYRTKNDDKRVKGTILKPIKISLPLSIVMAVLIFILSPYMASIFAKGDAVTQAGLTTIFQIFSVTLPFSVLYNLLLAASRGFQRVDYQVYTDNVFYSIVLVVSLALFSVFGLGIGGIVLSYALTVVASCLLIFYFFNRRIFRIFSETKPIPENRKLLGYVFPLFIGGMAGIIMSSFDTIFLGIFKTATDVGIYNAALPTAKFILVFSGAFGALFVPIMIEYRTKKMKQEILTIYRTTTKWIFFFGLPFALLLLFFSRNVLNVLFGPEYVSSSIALSILGIAFFIQSFLVTSTSMLHAIDKTKYTMIDMLLACFVGFALNIILIPQYGIFGAALATSLSLILYVLMDSIFAWKFTRMNPFDFKAFLKSIIAGIISMLFVLFIYRYIGMPSSALTLLPLFLLFLFVYSMLVLVFRTLDKNDIFILSEIEKKSGIRIGFVRKIFKRFAQ